MGRCRYVGARMLGAGALLLAIAFAATGKERPPLFHGPLVTFTGKIRSGTCNLSVAGGAEHILSARTSRPSTGKPLPLLWLRFTDCSLQHTEEMPAELLMNGVPSEKHLFSGLWGVEPVTGSGIALVTVTPDWREIPLTPGQHMLPLGSGEAGPAPLKMRGWLVRKGRYPVNVTAVVFFSAVYR